MIDGYDITIDDLPEELASLAEKIGLEATLAVVELYGGSSPYFPKLESVSRQARDRKICEEYKGGSLTPLRIKYNLSEAQLREILKKGRKDRLCGKKEWQLELPFN